MTVTLTLLSLLMILLVGSVPVALTVLVAWLMWAARIEWRGIWRGHVIVLRNTTFSEILYIDGQEVTTGEGRLKLETLTGTIEDGGERVPVLALLEPANLGFSVGARLFVAGEAIPLERGGIGSFTSDRFSVKQDARVPSDPRWGAMLTLLERVRQRGGEEVASVCSQATAQVRTLLLDIEDIAVAEEAHKLLDGDTGQAWREAAALREQRETTVKALFQAIQALHLQTTAGEGSVDPSDLLARLQGEVEVAATRDLRRERLAHDQLRARVRQ